MSEMNFDRLYDFFSKIPSVQKERIIAHGTDEQHAWWFKFSINVEHALAWQTVQELGHVLNYLSTNVLQANHKRYWDQIQDGYIE